MSKIQLLILPLCFELVIFSIPVILAVQAVQAQSRSSTPEHHQHNNNDHHSFGGFQLLSDNNDNNDHPKNSINSAITDSIIKKLEKSMALIMTIIW